MDDNLCEARDADVAALHRKYYDLLHAGEPVGAARQAVLDLAWHAGCDWAFDYASLALPVPSEVDGTGEFPDYAGEGG